jgi:hypothetical protein
MSANTTLVTKASGVSVPFNVSKLITSLVRSGTSKETAQQIADQVQQKLYPGISTSKIYRIAFGLLKKLKQPVAARYKLKQAIMQLGPSGFPFELYFSRLLIYNGYKVEVGVVVKGKCISHELDIIGANHDSKIMVECKYHNRQGVVCDVKIPLYIQSRFIDVQYHWIETEKQNNIKYQGWVVTNTRFTADAIQYGNCVGLNLIGWDYPQSNNLRQMIDKSKLYPITCLTTLTQHEKQLLLDKKIVLINEIKKGVNILMQSGTSETRLLAVLNEVSELLKPTNAK